MRPDPNRGDAGRACRGRARLPGPGVRQDPEGRLTDRSRVRQPGPGGRSADLHRIPCRRVPVSSAPSPRRGPIVRAAVRPSGGTRCPSRPGLRRTWGRPPTVPRRMSWWLCGRSTPSTAPAFVCCAGRRPGPGSMAGAIVWCRRHPVCIKCFAQAARSPACGHRRNVPGPDEGVDETMEPMSYGRPLEGETRK